MKPTRLRLTRNWRRLHRSYTVIVSLSLAVLAAAVEHLPLFAGVMSPSVFAWTSMAAGVAIAVLRYIDQPCLRGGDSLRGGLKAAGHHG